MDNVYPVVMMAKQSIFRASPSQREGAGRGFALVTTLTARSDTFVIRSYGDALDEHGTIKARAWCEAVVQRTPTPVNPTKVGLNPADVGQEHEFGRRFTIQSFRWLNPDEI